MYVVRNPVKCQPPVTQKSWVYMCMVMSSCVVISFTDHRGHDPRSRGRRGVGDVIHGVVQYGRFPLAVRLRSVRQSEGTS